MLLRQLAHGDVSKMTKYLASTQGIVGIVALFMNQFGGKLSDSLGRRPFLTAASVSGGVSPSDLAARVPLISSPNVSPKIGLIYANSTLRSSKLMARMRETTAETAGRLVLPT